MGFVLILDTSNIKWPVQLVNLEGSHTDWCLISSQVPRMIRTERKHLGGRNESGAITTGGQGRGRTKKEGMESDEENPRKGQMAW